MGGEKSINRHYHPLTSLLSYDEAALHYIQYNEHIINLKPYAVTRTHMYCYTYSEIATT